MVNYHNKKKKSMQTRSKKQLNNPLIGSKRKRDELEKVYESSESEESNYELSNVTRFSI